MESIRQLIVGMFMLLVVVSCFLVFTEAEQLVWAMWAYAIVGAIILYVVTIPFAILAWGLGVLSRALGGQ